MNKHLFGLSRASGQTSIPNPSQKNSAHLFFAQIRPSGHILVPKPSSNRIGPPMIRSNIPVLIWALRAMPSESPSDFWCYVAETFGAHRITNHNNRQVPYFTIASNFFTETLGMMVKSQHSHAEMLYGVNFI